MNYSINASMNKNTAHFLKRLEQSELQSVVYLRAKQLVGRNDAVERLAEYLQDICPRVLCLTVDAKTCVQFEHDCGIDFHLMSQAIIFKLDPIRLV